MKDMDAEMVRRELIDAFEFILELDRNPEMLEKLPKRSVMVKSGSKRMFIPTTKEPKIVML